MSVILYTIGHSDRDIEELVRLLTAQGITTLVDIRSNPQSSRHPQFSQETLRNTLASKNIVYHWAGRQLGGLRKAENNSVHTALEHGLRGFADYMASAGFERAAAQLQQLASRSPTAILCAEKLPENCHRSLIADYLVLNGNEVIHIIDSDTAYIHQLRTEARRESAELIYDRAG